MTFFNTTEYLVKKSRKIFQDDGILGKPNRKKGRTLPENVIEHIKVHYYDDDISRVSSNTRDVISVPTESGKRELKPKRLILHNLKDVYLDFKEKHPNDNVGFAKFCALRPKECVTVSSRGIHRVCVCTYHQNVKLMLLSVHLCITYEELLLKIVCDLQSEECMLHRCPNCPGITAVKEYLMELETFETVDNITFRQWLHTDRSTFETLVQTVDEFIDNLVNKLDALTQHHFISKSQSVYLKDIKQNIGHNECVILVDFSENYTCIVQDASQGFHWHNIQVTVHPVVVYFRRDGEVRPMTMCFISNCLKHDTTTFFAMQKKAISYILLELPEVTHAIYFSDGSGGQYKNYKNFINLCHHKDDHGITAQWNFFGTSHGKNACDGVGGTIKRLATRASLQRTGNNPILSAQDLYQFAVENVKGIKTFYISEEEVQTCTKFLEERYGKAKTVPGTRENHYFEPLDKTHLLVKRVSSSNVSFKVAVGSEERENVVHVAPEMFYAVVYNKLWWIGKVTEISTINRDAKVEFMHPCGPSQTFYWPTKKDSCWVQFENILLEIPVPGAASTSGRNYCIDETVQKSVISAFRTFD